MIGKVETIFAGAAVVVTFAAYLWSSATSGINPVEWNDGDLIVQQSKTVPVLPVFGTKTEAPAHIGIVQLTDSGAVVIEASETVTETPLADFISHGRSRQFAAYRVAALTPIQSRLVISAARSRIGMHGDFFLDPDADQIYSSELVRMAYLEAGIDLGKMQRLGTLAKGNPTVSSKFMGKWQQSKPCKRRYLDYDQCWNTIARYDVITPMSLISDPHVRPLYSSPGASPVVMAEGSAEPSQMAGTGGSVDPAAPSLGLRP
ncbi:MAG: YiiX/YebB-like N1pC/P60 family cysteine hydrolase [Micropepsaceae bacterium]